MKIIQKYLFSEKEAANKTGCSSLEWGSIIRFIVAEKCKQSEMYIRICDVYGKACFSEICLQIDLT